MDKILQNHRIIVCTGSGGVGKTSLSAALGLRAARSGLKVLVLTIDPARRLAVALGMGDAHGAVQVEVPELRGRLYAEMIEPERIFEDFIRRLAPREEVVQSVLQNAFYKQLTTTLSGSQEFTSLVRLYEAASSKEYDLIILDTPPAEHAIDFLNAPEKLSAMFQGKVVRWFAGKPEDLSLVARLMHRSTRTLVNTMEVLAGAGFMKDLAAFFDSLRTLVDDIADTSRRAHDLLLSPETAFVLMTSLDQAKLQEGAEFCEELDGSGYRLRAVIVNRAYPRWFLEEPEKTAAKVGTIASPGLAKLVGEMVAYFQCRGQFQGRFNMSGEEPVRVIKIPELDEDVYGLEALARLGAYLREPGEDDRASVAVASAPLTA